MEQGKLRRLVDLADGIESRLTKADSLLTVLRSTRTSTANDEVMHEYIQTVQDLVEETRELKRELWEEILRQCGQGPA
jgi:hypothetical protein